MLGNDERRLLVADSCKSGRARFYRACRLLANWRRILTEGIEEDREGGEKCRHGS